MRLSDENLRGRSVIAADGQVIGELAAIYVESSSWRVESLQVKLRSEIADQLGVHRSVFRSGTFEVPVRFVQSLGDTLVLNVPASRLRDVLPAPQASVARPD